MTGKEKHMEYLQAKAKLDDIRGIDIIEGDPSTREARFLFRSIVNVADALLYAFIKGDPRSLLIEIHGGNTHHIDVAEAILNKFNIITTRPLAGLFFKKVSIENELE